MRTERGWWIPGQVHINNFGVKILSQFRCGDIVTFLVWMYNYDLGVDKLWQFSLVSGCEMDACQGVTCLTVR